MPASKSSVKLKRATKISTEFCFYAVVSSKFDRANIFLGLIYKPANCDAVLVGLNWKLMIRKSEDVVLSERVSVLGTITLSFIL